MANMETAVGEAFIRFARHKLLQEDLPRIRRCLEELREEDIWWRAHETNNSIGNLVLHLCGNVGQWIISGLGERVDVRDRSAEFAARGSIPKGELLKLMELTLQEADETLARFDVGRLLETKTIQGFKVSCLDAIFHVVEHFSGHTGQIIYITKLRSGKDLKFFNL